MNVVVVCNYNFCMFSFIRDGWQRFYVSSCLAFAVTLAYTERYLSEIKLFPDKPPTKWQCYGYEYHITSQCLFIPQTKQPGSVLSWSLTKSPSLVVT